MSDKDLEFIELVNEEKWTEEGETFMALRQTILTSLICSDDEDLLSQYFRMGDTVLVDLSDFLLSSTGIDASIVALVLEKFLQYRPPNSRSIIGMSSFFR